MRSLPCQIGTVHTRTATQLAEAAIEYIASRTEFRSKRLPAYEVTLDAAGRLVVDKLGTSSPTEWLMTCTRKSDPDVLADEIRAEVESRDGVRPRRHCVVGARRAA